MHHTPRPEPPRRGAAGRGGGGPLLQTGKPRPSAAAAAVRALAVLGVLAVTLFASVLTSLFENPEVPLPSAFNECWLVMLPKKLRELCVASRCTGLTTSVR